MLTKLKIYTMDVPAEEQAEEAPEPCLPLHFSAKISDEVAHQLYTHSPTQNRAGIDPPRLILGGFPIAREFYEVYDRIWHPLSEQVWWPVPGDVIDQIYDDIEDLEDIEEE